MAKPCSATLMSLRSSPTAKGERLAVGLIEQDFTPGQRRDFTIRKEILWESETVADVEVRQVEIGFIRQLGANDPRIGYNRSPRFKPDE